MPLPALAVRQVPTAQDNQNIKMVDFQMTYSEFLQSYFGMKYSIMIQYLQ